jgi:hypothetical protein
MNNVFDIIYIGFGTATAFSLAHLINKEKQKNKKILVIEKGKNLKNRTSVTSGSFGAGIYSDAKIIISLETGGEIINYVSKEKCYALEKDFFSLINKYCTFFYSIKHPEYKDKYLNNFEVISNKVLHLGTDYGRIFAQNILNDIEKNSNIIIKNEEEVKTINKKENIYEVITDKEIYFSSIIVYATGKSGVKTTNHLIEKFKLKSFPKKALVGIRVEVPFEITKKLTNLFYDFKLKLVLPKGEVRSFCVSPYGEVIKENFFGYISYNGGSSKEVKTNFTNFGIMCVPKNIGKFNSFTYQQEVVKQFNEFPEEQRIVNWEKWRKENYIKKIFGFGGVYDSLTEWMIKFELICPNFLKNIKIYMPEVKYSSDSLDLNQNLCLKDLSNFYVIGDSSYGRGIYQAALGGILVSQNL